MQVRRSRAALASPAPALKSSGHVVACIGACVVWVGLLCAAPAEAAAPTRSASVGDGGLTAQVHLAYEAYATGLSVLEFAVGIDITTTGYRVELDFHSAGMFGAIVHADTNSVVAGTWTARGVAPARFYSYGHLRGVPRRTQIDFAAGQPQVVVLEPEEADEREPVPDAMRRDTVDTLSAMALLVRTLATTGRCDGGVRTFDGRRVSEITVRDAGTETLDATSRSSFAGPARRCDFEGRQLAGFARDADPQELRRIQHGSAWLAPVLPGTAPVPVRMSFHTRFFGDATMYVTQAAPGATLPAQ